MPAYLLGHLWPRPCFLPALCSCSAFLLELSLTSSLNPCLECQVLASCMLAQLTPLCQWGPLGQRVGTTTRLMQIEWEAEPLYHSLAWFERGGLRAGANFRREVHPASFSKAWLKMSCGESAVSESRPSIWVTSVRGHEALKWYGSQLNSIVCRFQVWSYSKSHGRSLICHVLSWHWRPSCILPLHQHHPNFCKSCAFRFFS